MNNKFDLAIFDVDGTVLDTTEGVISSVKYTIEKMNFTMPDDNVLASFIGPPIQDSFAEYYGLQGEILQQIATVFRNHYSNVDLYKAQPYCGIMDVFKSLTDFQIKTAIATYKREDYAVKLLKYFEFDKYTSIIHGGDHENRLKKADIINICIEESGISDRNRIVMIGDTIHDAVGAKNVGINFIGVTYGFGFKQKLKSECLESICFVNNAEDLKKQILI